MKHLIRISIMAFVMFLFTFAACQDDEDTQIVREDLFLKWNCVAYEGDSESNYDVTIKKSESASNEVIITNFNNWGNFEAVAILTGSVLTFKDQEINSYKLSGEGTISDNLQQIKWVYILKDDFEEITITSTFSAAGTAKKKGI